MKIKEIKKRISAAKFEIYKERKHDIFLDSASLELGRYATEALGDMIHKLKNMPKRGTYRLVRVVSLEVLLGSKKHRSKIAISDEEIAEIDEITENGSLSESEIEEYDNLRIIVPFSFRSAVEEYGRSYCLIFSK